MKNWSLKLIAATITTVAACLLLTALCRMLHLEFWTWTIALVASFIIAISIMMYVIKVVTKAIPALLLALIPTGMCFLANQWCFYSANETVHFANINELTAAKEKPLYFTLDTYYWDTDGTGTAEITTEHKKRGVVTSTTQDIYIAIPMYADTLSDKIKVWLVDDYPKSEYEAVEDYESLLKPDEILNFELLTEELDDYKVAVGYSPYKDKAENAIFITPMYDEYITKNTWGLYFLVSFVIGIAVMALLGLFFTRRDKKNAEEEELKELEELEKQEKQE